MVLNVAQKLLPGDGEDGGKVAKKLAGTGLKSCKKVRKSYGKVKEKLKKVGFKCCPKVAPRGGGKTVEKLVKC